MRIVTVVGARPQFVKAAAVSRALLAADSIEETLVHTGQHYDTNMSQVFFDELEIPPPAHHLAVGSGSHGQQTGKMLAAVEQVIQKIQPDWLLVYGDTNSTLAGALAAAKLHVPVAHVEAGLRSFDRRMPEEVNRVLTDHASNLLLAPTETAVANLRREGLPDAAIRLVGDVMYDVALHYGEQADRRSNVLKELRLASKSYILATIHRAENTDDDRRLRAIFAGLTETAKDCPVVMPLHPRTRGALVRAGLLADAERSLRLIEPVGYLDMIQLERHARLVTTDSGGVQKEAFFFEVPCVTLRDQTEWVETVELGLNRLVAPVAADVVAAGIRAALAPAKRGPLPAVFGGGKAAEAIARELLAGCSTAGIAAAA